MGKLYEKGVIFLLAGTMNMIMMRSCGLTGEVQEDSLPELVIGGAEYAPLFLCRYG